MNDDQKIQILVAACSIVDAPTQVEATVKFLLSLLRDEQLWPICFCTQQERFNYW